MKPYLSVIIPAYKEGARLPRTFPIFENFAKKAPYKVEILFVEDGSPDNTAEVIKKLIEGKESFRLLEFTANHGKGYAVKRGMLKARGEYRLFADADNSTPIEQVEKLLKFVSQYDVVIGSRYIGGGRQKLKQPLYRIIGARVLNFFIRLSTGLKIEDTQCGFKLFSEKAAKVIFSRLTFERFSFDVEVLFIAKKHGFNIKEIGVDWYNDPASTVSPIKDGLRFLGALVKLRLNWLAGKYK